MSKTSITIESVPTSMQSSMASTSSRTLLRKRRSTAAVLNRSVQESADAELACQMQLDEVIATSLAMAMTSDALPHDPSDSITQEDTLVESLEEVGTSRPAAVLPEGPSAPRHEAQDDEWTEDIDDPAALLYNFSFGQQRRRLEDEPNHFNKDEVIEYLREQYRLFRLRATSSSPAPESEWSDGEVCETTSELLEDADDAEEEEDYETCNICLTTEITAINSHAASEKCLHKFCTDCLIQHGDMTVKSGKSHIPCPEFECEESWSVKMCEILLSPDALLLLNQRQVEDAVEEWERVYCPYKDCSCLQLRPPSPHPEHVSLTSGVQCLSCHRYFCLECQVPWHEQLTCEEYKNLPEDERSPRDIALLRGLAAENKWQRCTCGHLVEKTTGCNHITCRCGREFCYVCNEEWLNHACRGAN